MNEQLRCLDSRLECQQSQLLEIQVSQKIVKIIKLILNIWGRVQAARRDRAQLLPRPGEALQAAHLQAQGAEAEGEVITFIASTYYS